LGTSEGKGICPKRKKGEGRRERKEKTKKR